MHGHYARVRPNQRMSPKRKITGQPPRSRQTRESGLVDYGRWSGVLVSCVKVMEVDEHEYEQLVVLIDYTLLCYSICHSDVCLTTLLLQTTLPYATTV